MVLRLLMCLLTIAAISAGVFVIPSIAAKGYIEQIITASAVATFLTELSAVWFFLSSLDAFKRKLKLAYYLVAFGFLTYALFVLPVIWTSLGFSIDPISQSIFTLAPFIFGTVILYVGVRLFARQLNVRSLWTSAWFVVGLSLAAALAIGVLSQSPYPELPNEIYRVLIGLVAWSTSFTIAATILIVKIRLNISIIYQTSITWLTIAIGTLGFIGVHELLIKTSDFVAKTFPEYFAAYIYLFTLVVAIFFLGAGMAFREVSKKLSVLPENASYLDVITYVAQMVSNPQAIDVTLDKVREITARNAKGDITAADKKTLVAVYQELEHYLIEKEPLVKITREDLRVHLPDDFRQTLETQQK